MFTLNHPKLIALAETEGYSDVTEFLGDYALDSVVPAICMSPDCDHTTDLEPDQRAGYCDACGRPTMKSALVIAGMI